jgi:hypothetical protein
LLKAGCVSLSRPTTTLISCQRVEKSSSPEGKG